MRDRLSQCKTYGKINKLLYLVLWLLLSFLYFVLLDACKLFAQPDDSQSRMLQRARHSVVIISSGDSNRVGTGSIVKIDGRKAYVLTAFHVLAHSENLGKEKVNILLEEVEVELFTGSRLKVIPNPKWVDTNNDFALFALDSIPSEAIPSLPWDTSIDSQIKFRGTVYYSAVAV